MKKILLTAIIAVSLVTSSFATETVKVNSSAKRHFKSEFLNAKDVEWKTTNSYTAATFVSDGIKKQAFYDLQGELLGTSQAVSLESVPSTAKRALAKKYSDYVVKEAIKFDGSKETAYFISAENQSTSVILKIVDNQVSVFK